MNLLQLLQLLQLKISHPKVEEKFYIYIYINIYINISVFLRWYRLKRTVATVATVAE